LIRLEALYEANADAILAGKWALENRDGTTNARPRTKVEAAMAKTLGAQKPTRKISRRKASKCSGPKLVRRSISRRKEMVSRCALSTF